MAPVAMLRKEENGGDGYDRVFVDHLNSSDADVYNGGPGDDSLEFRFENEKGTPGDVFNGGPGADRISLTNGPNAGVVCDDATTCKVANSGLSCSAPEIHTCQLDATGAGVCACGAE